MPRVVTSLGGGGVERGGGGLLVSGRRCGSVFSNLTGPQHPDWLRWQPLSSSPAILSWSRSGSPSDFGSARIPAFHPFCVKFLEGLLVPAAIACVTHRGR